MTAALMLPNINPTMRMDSVFRIFLTTNSTAPKTKKEPKLAASAMLQDCCASPAKTPPKREAPNKRKATPRLAPELIPKTKGPAKGFLKRVCINKPLMPKPDPTRMAVMAFGIL